MRKILIVLFVLLIPSVCWPDSEVTIGGKTGQAVIWQDEGVSLRPRPFVNMIGAGVACSDTGGKTVCSITATGGGGAAANSFETWAIPQGDNPVADSSTDTVTFLEGGGVRIDGSSTDDSVTFTVAEATSSVKGILSISDTDHMTLTSGDMQFSDNMKELLDNYNGMMLETPTITVTSDTVTIVLSIEKSGGGDLTFHFSDGFAAFDTTPAATVDLTAGSDTSPQTNWVFIPQSTKTLTSNTTGFPVAEHARVAKIIVQSASTVDSTGALSVHVHRDHTEDSNNQGHGTVHVGNWIRHQHATWLSPGVVQTFTFNSAPTPDEIDFATTSGTILQLHEHTFPVFDTSSGDLIFVINDNSTPYTTTSDIETLLTDSAGVSMSGRYYNLVFWGSISEETKDSQIFVNLPSGSYNKQSDAISDVSGFTNFTFPDSYRGGAFLISRITIQNSGGGNVFTNIEEKDLRGFVPNIVAGGGTSSITTVFADNNWQLFDETTVDKTMQFQLSGITSGNNRVMTVPDASGNLAYTSQTDGTIDHGADVGGLGDYDHSAYENELTNSAGLLAALDDETGTVLAVFSNTPTLVTPVLGAATATSVTATSIILSDGLLDGVGAVDQDYGSADVTDHTFVSDGGTAIIDGFIKAGGTKSQIISEGTAPGVASCGTSPSISATATDIGGKVTIGSTASSTCTITFDTAYTNAPACVVTNGTIDVPVFATTTTTVLTLTDGAQDFSSDVIMYICTGQE